MKKAKHSQQHADFIASATKAMKAAAKEARRIAKMHGTKIWVEKDGKIVGLDP